MKSAKLPPQETYTNGDWVDDFRFWAGAVGTPRAVGVLSAAIRKRPTTTTPSDGEPDLVLTSGNGYLVVSANVGQIRVPKAVMEDLEPGVYDFDMVEISDGRPLVRLRGILNLERGVTP